MAKKRQNEEQDEQELAAADSGDVATIEPTSDGSADYMPQGEPVYEQGKLLTMTEAAGALNVHRSTILRWIQDGLLRFVLMPNKMRRVPESQVLEIKRIMQHNIT